jgi:hypothetical protein
MSSQFVRKALETVLDQRESPKTICPSEAARLLSSADLRQLGVQNWREAMPAVRDAVWEMRSAGEVEVLQQKKVLSDETRPSDVKGPIRVRRINDDASTK